MRDMPPSILHASLNTPLKETLSRLSHKKLPGLDWVGFREVRETASVRYVRDGRPEHNSTGTSHGVMVEALVDGQFGYAATTRLDPESLLRAVEQAHAQAARAAKYAVHRFTEKQRPPTRASYSSTIRKPVESISPGELNGLLIRICERMKKSPKIVRTTGFAMTVKTEMRLVSSNGAESEQEFSFVTVDFESTAQDGPVVQKRTDGGMRGRCHQGGAELIETPDLWARVDQVADQALELIAAPECPTETTNLVLTPDQMMLQIHESIGHPLELDRILGDERNYAGWSFVKLEDIGTLQYGSPIMNITFDPTVQGEFASYAIDDNGNPARREHLIRDGKLVRALGGLESQERSGKPGVANARASMWNRPAIDRMANINLEPGDRSFEQIISSIERGVLMESNRSWSIDDFRNKFQFGCEYAKLIENGQLTKTVRNPNYRGVTVPFWKGLKQVGNDATRGVFGTPNCGKGEPSQAIRVGHASPVCHFENVEVFGGAS
jgi:predicted Zn-dependent protease